MAQDFHLGDLLSVTTGKLVSPEGISGVYKILNYMTGESVFTHQIPRIVKEATLVLLRQHPQLAAVDLADVTPDNYHERIAAAVAEHGELFSVQPMSTDEHESIDPLSELVEKIHPDKIINVET